MFFGPEGLEFDMPVDITLPFTPGDLVDEDDLSVVVRNADGSEEVLPDQDYTVDLGNREVTVTVDHFSTYQVLGPPPEPGEHDLNADGVPDVVITSGRPFNPAGYVEVDFGPTLTAAAVTASSARTRVTASEPRTRWETSTATASPTSS